MTPSNFQDLTGMKFGRLTVISRAENGKNWKVRWNCHCDCGNDVTVYASHLMNGHTQSCGCYNKDIIRSRNKENRKYKYCNTRIYDCWKDMLRRCYNNDDEKYHTYYEKGITVCEEWHDFKIFQEWALNNGYQDNLTIDRIDNNGNYCPENCRWTTLKIQANNTSRNRKIEYQGEIKTLAQWCDQFNLPYKIIENRINRYNWAINEAFEIPIGMKRKTYYKSKEMDGVNDGIF